MAKITKDMLLSDALKAYYPEQYRQNAAAFDLAAQRVNSAYQQPQSFGISGNTRLSELASALSREQEYKRSHPEYVTTIDRIRELKEERDRQREELIRMREQAKGSIMSYDAGGKLNSWQTALNMLQDSKDYAAARTDLGVSADTSKAAREERRFAADEAKRGIAWPQTAEAAKKQLGTDYELEEAPFWSKLLGHPVYKKAKGVTNAEVHGLDKNASAGDVLAKTASDTRQGFRQSWDMLTREPEKTGNEQVDNWFQRGHESNEAARRISETYGIPTYALEGSLTQQTADAYTNSFQDKNFLQKMGANAGVAAADYAQSIINAGLTSADFLSGGRLSSGTGTASSIYHLANFAQNAASGLTGQAFNSMRESSNWLGKLTLDLEKTGVEQILDLSLGGTGSLGVMGARVFGAGAQEAEDRGESLGRQVLTGGVRGAIEVGTEMLGGVGGSWRGTGYGDAFFGKLDKWVASKTGSELIGTLANAFGSEAVEEMIADVLNPLADRIFGIGEATGRGEDRTFMQGLGDFLSDVWGDGQLLYDGLLGGLAGALGGAGQHFSYSAGAKNLATDVGTYKAAQRIAGSNKLRAQFTEMTGLKLSENEQDAITQVAAYLTNITDAVSGTSGQSLESQLMRGKGAESKGTYDTAIINKAARDLELTPEETELLTKNYDSSTQTTQEYAQAVREAHFYGSQGLTLDQAKSQVQRAGTDRSFAGSLNEKQLESAWWTGNRAYQEREAAREAAEADTADVKTAEGKAKLSTQLAGLGIHAEAAANVYESNQDVSKYAGRMVTAAALASAGVDVPALYQKQKGDGKAGGLRYLTQAQIETAARIGKQMRADRMKQGKQKSARFAQIKAQLEEGRMPADVQESLRETRSYLKDLTVEIGAVREGLNEIRANNPEMVNSQEYKDAVERLHAMEADAENVREIIKKIKEAGKTPGKGKKGSAVYAKQDGQIKGKKYKAIDRSKLSKTQKSVGRVAEVIARVSGLNIVLAEFEKTPEGRALGGMYLPGTGGTVYLNIGNVGVNGKNISIASLSHELTHFLQDYAPEQYEELKQFVLQEMARNPEEFESIFQARRGTEMDLSPEQLTDEMVANACMTVLQDDAAVQRLVREHQTLAERIRDFILKFVDDLKAAFADIDTKDNFTLYREVRLAEGALDEIRERWVNAFAVAAENLQNEAETKNTAPESGVQYMKMSSEYDAETATIKEQLDNSSEKLNSMEPVARKNVPHFKTGEKSKAAAWAIKELKAKGYHADRQGYGRIYFSEADIDQAARYADTPAEKGALSLVYDVVKRGIEIGRHQNHDNRGKKTITFGAPVVLNGERGNMAVVVNQRSNHFYAERIVLPNGSAFVLPEIKETPQELPRGVAQKSSLAEATSSASKNSIANLEEIVNINDPVGQMETAESSGVQYSVFVEDPETLKFLDDQEKAGEVIRTYKTFLEIDGKLYPPMASMKKDKNGKWKMTKAMELGRWEASVGDPSKIVVDPKNGRGYYILKKDNGDTVKAAYNPYQHSSNLMLNDQFAGAYDRPNLVTYECIIPESELTSGYRADYAKDAVGVHSWKAGPVAGKLLKAKGMERQVYLSRWLKPARRVPDAEVAQHYKELLDGTDIAVPSNVVPPSLLEALEDAGVKIQYTKQAPKRERITTEENGQMRLQFQMISDVEETDKLVAVHNKSVSGLRRMLQRGGVPFPSIAIKKAGSSHEGFGDVSIVFPRSTIDPEVNRNNRLYSNDAWTPTEPGTEYDVGDTYRYQKKLKKQLGEDIFNALRGGSFLDESELAKKLKYSKGDIIEALKGINVLKYAYLDSIGQAPEIPMRTQSLDGFGRYKNEQLLDFFNELSESEIEAADYSADTTQKVADILNRKVLERFEEGSDTWKKLKEKPIYSADKVNLVTIKEAYRQYLRNGKSIPQEYDYHAFDREMFNNKALEEDKGYQKWLQDTFSDLIVDSGIRNDKDIFTPSGNRRSFKQLHVPATLENIVKEMQKMDEKAIGGFGNINLRGAATRTYRNVEEMRADSGKLLGTHIADDVYDGYMKGFFQRLHDMVGNKFGTDSNNINDWQRIDSVEASLLEAIRDCETKQQMRNKLRSEEKWFPGLSDLTDDLWQLKKDVRNMPAPYFEAKPRRVVYPQEALAYILPNSDEAADVLQELQERGYNVMTYEAGDEADRLAKLNSVEGAQFQTWDGDQARMDEFDTMHPTFRARQQEVEQLTEDLVAYFKGVAGENAISEEEIRDYMEQNLYNSKLYGDLNGADEILGALSDIAQSGRGKTKAYELMERLIPHMDVAVQQVWVNREGGNRNEAFAKWYNRKHPSLYYSGYKPGDLFAKGYVAPDVDPWLNLHKERGYLHKLLNNGNLVEPELTQARDLLNRLMSPRGEVFYQQWDDAHNDWAPTFYSQMSKTIDEWSNEKGRPMPAKMASNAVIPWLRGRGVKAEEIRWSGVQDWLAGRKSVTKEELQAFMEENKLQIETKVLGSFKRSDKTIVAWFEDGSPNYFNNFEELEAYADKIAQNVSGPGAKASWWLDGESKELDENSGTWANVSEYVFETQHWSGEGVMPLFTAEVIDRPNDAGETHWSQHITPGGINYREILFKMPIVGNYSNDASRAHWDSDAPGTVAHARVQDMTDKEGNNILFVEEIQSDLHNAGSKGGYRGDNTKEQKKVEEISKKLEELTPNYDKARAAAAKLGKNIFEQVADDPAVKGAMVTPDKIIRFVCGDINAFTPRYSDPNRRKILQYAVDAQIAVFRAMQTSANKEILDAFVDVNKYRLEYERLEEELGDAMDKLRGLAPDVPFAGRADTYHEYVMKHLLREAAEGGYDGIGWTSADMQSARWSFEYEEGYRIEYDQNIPKFMRKYTKQWGGTVGTTVISSGDEVWYAPINVEMRRNVLKVGQPLYQQWDDTYDDTADEMEGREEAYARLQAEQAILDDALAGVRELTKKEKKTLADIRKRLQIGKDPEVRLKDAKKLAQQLIKDQNSTADVDEIAADIKYIGDYILQSGDPTMTVINQLARETAEKIATTAQEVVDDSAGEMYGKIRDSIKGAKLTVDPAEVGDIGGVETLNEFRKKNFGRFSVVSRDSKSVTADHISVEQFYDDLHAEFGDYYFPEPGTDNGPANGGEMLRIIADMFDTGEPMTVNPNEQYMGEAIESIAHQITFAALNDALRMEPLTKTERLKADKAELKAEVKQSRDEIRRLEGQVRSLSKKLEKTQERFDQLQKQYAERLERVRREGTARAQERVARERAKKYEKIAELKQHYQEMEQRARERRQNTNLRKKIRKLIDQLNAKLARPTEKRHVPREMVQLTVDVLKMLDYDSGRGGAKFAEKIAQIRNMYDSYQKNPTYSVVYDDAVSEMLQGLTEKIGDGNIYHMSDAQLEAVYKTLKSLNHVIEEAVSVRIGNEERNAFEVAQEMTAETRGVPKAQRGWWKAHWLPAGLRPDVAFRRFAGFKKNSTWESMARLLNDGQLKQTWIQMQLSAGFADLINNGAAMRDMMGMNALGMIDPEKLIDIGLRDENGDAILVTHGIALGIWFDLQNEDNRRHFIRGGKTVPNMREYYDGKGGFDYGAQRAVGIATELSDLYHQLKQARENQDTELVQELDERIEEVMLTGENYADKVQKLIEKQMTDFDREWIRATRHLMNVEAKRILNQTTMEVYGIEKAGVDNYYPITTDKNFLNTPFESITKNMNLENAGFMKERVQSGNPTLALDISSVVNDQIRRVSQYAGIMPAVRSFNKVFNKMGAGYSDSLKNALSGVFGKSGTEYVENLIADMTGSRREAEDSLGLGRLLGALRGNLAQTTLTLNLRVAMSQAASYPTAAAELGWGPLAKALRKGGKDGRIISPADQELIATYSPLLWLRMQGYSTVELGDIKNSQKLMARFWKKMRWATGWIQAVDGATVGRLWSATEYWVDENMPHLQKGSDEYYQEVAKKFNDVVEKTQPNYTTMQRAAILRDPNSVMKMLTMFMTQRLQNFNIIYDNAAAYQKARADFAAKRNGVTEADLAEAKTQAIRAVTSQLAQAATFVAFKFVADALLRNLKPYRDDEDGELNAKGISMQLLNNYIDAIAGSFLFGSELLSITKAVTGTGKWYGLSLNGVDSLNDLVDSIVALSPANYDLSTDKGKTKFRKALSNFGTSAAQALGIPLNNGIKIGKAIEQWVMGAINGTWFDEGFEPTAAQQKIRDAEAAGIPKDLYNRAMKEAETSGNTSLTQDELGTWLQKELKAKRITKQQADAIWNTRNWKTDFDKWREKH